MEPGGLRLGSVRLHGEGKQDESVTSACESLSDGDVDAESLEHLDGHHEVVNKIISLFWSGNVASSKPNDNFGLPDVVVVLIQDSVGTLIPVSIVTNLRCQVPL